VARRVWHAADGREEAELVLMAKNRRVRQLGARRCGLRLVVAARRI